MKTDAIIVADAGSDSFSGSNPLKLKIDGKIADIQVVKNFLDHGGQIRSPIDGDGMRSWASAKRLNGLALLDYLTKLSFRVELIDNFDVQREAFEALLNDSPCAVIISTTFIVSKPALKQLISDIRHMASNIPIIVGGPFVYVSYLMRQRIGEPDYEIAFAKKDFLFLEYGEEPDADLYIVSLKGENTLAGVLARIKSNRPFQDLPNCAFRKNGGYIFTPHHEDLKNAHNGVIDWERMPESLFQSRVVPMQASNGCPYNCSFCNFVKDRHHTFVKPLDQLISELKAVKKRGVQYVWFVDDNFRLGKDDLKTVCRRFIDEKLGLKWMTFVRADTLDRMDIGLLRDAGCMEVQLGLESADLQVLKNMNKKATPELYDKVLNRLLSSGINCSCYFIMGFPGETLDSAKRTRSFIIEHQRAEYEGSLSWSIFPFILGPLSPIYEPEMRRQYNLTGYMEKWKHATMDAKQAYDQVVKTILEIDDSGPIYRGDNLEMIRQLDYRKRKAFYAQRHRLSKASLHGQLGKTELYKCFKSVLK